MNHMIKNCGQSLNYHYKLGLESNKNMLPIPLSDKNDLKLKEKVVPKLIIGCRRKHSTPFSVAFWIQYIMNKI